MDRRSNDREAERVRGRAGVAQRARRLSDHPLCRTCQKAGRIVATAEIDHVVPLSRGGADDDDNVQGLCAECHRRKTAAEQPPRRIGQAVGADGWPTDGTDRPKG